MRNDLPLCNLKTCRHCFYGNCTNKNKHDVCEYAFLKRSMERIVERLEEAAFPQKFGGNTEMMILKNRAIEIVKEEMEV